MGDILILELQEQRSGVLWWRSSGKPTCDIELAMRRQWSEIETHAHLFDNAIRQMAVPFEIAKQHTRRVVPMFVSAKAMQDVGAQAELAFAAINSGTAAPEPMYVMRADLSMSPLFMALLSPGGDEYEVELENAGEFSIPEAAKACASISARRHKHGGKATASNTDIVIPKSVATRSAIRVVPDSRNIVRILRDESVLHRQTLKSF